MGLLFVQPFPVSGAVSGDSEAFSLNENSPINWSMVFPEQNASTIGAVYARKFRNCFTEVIQQLVPLYI